MGEWGDVAGMKELMIKLNSAISKDELSNWSEEESDSEDEILDYEDPFYS